MPIVVSELYNMYYKYAYFNFYYYCFYFLFFCLLIARDKCLLFYNRAILSFGYHMLIFLSVVFSLRTKHVTSQHNL